MDETAKARISMGLILSILLFAGTTGFTFWAFDDFPVNGEKIKF